MKTLGRQEWLHFLKRKVQQQVLTDLEHEVGPNRATMSEEWIDTIRTLDNVNTLGGLVNALASLGWDVESIFGFIFAQTTASTDEEIGFFEIPGAHGYDT